MTPHLKTLTRYLIETRQAHGVNSTGDLNGLLNAVTTAIKMVANQVNKGILGVTAEVIHAGNGTARDELQAKLAKLTCDVLVRETEWAGHLNGIASQANEASLPISEGYKRGKYLLVIDPLHGSAEMDLNIPVGTIFSVLRAPNPGGGSKTEDFLQEGKEQVAAGFAMYGPSTMLVITTGHGVDGFTLDRDIGAFMLTHPAMNIAQATNEFAINASNSRFWEPPVSRYVGECLQGKDGPRGKDFNMRWFGSMVAAAYRILNRGGVYIYPRDNEQSRRGARLQLVFQVNPLAFILEQAGGAASTGRTRILDIVPEDLHQRVPMIFGSSEEVQLIERYHREHELGLDKEFDSPLFSSRSLFIPA